MSEVAFTPARGDSMAPMIKTGDILIYKKKNSLEIGDIVIFKKGNQTFAHRILKLKSGTIITKGDNLLFPDPPVAKTAIVGIVQSVLKKDFSFDPMPINGRASLEQVNLSRTGYRIGRLIKPLLLVWSFRKMYKSLMLHLQSRIFTKYYTLYPTLRLSNEKH